MALEDRPAAGAACFALSLAFKLQAVFLLPIVAVLWSAGKLRLADALTFLLTLLAAALPALLGGKSLAQIVSIYVGQTGLYKNLTYNAPGFFGLMNTNGLDVYAYGNFGIALALGAVCALLAALFAVCAAVFAVLAAALALPAAVFAALAASLALPAADCAPDAAAFAFSSAALAFSAAVLAFAIAVFAFAIAVSISAIFARRVSTSYTT